MFFSRHIHMAVYEIQLNSQEPKAIKRIDQHLELHCKLNFKRIDDIDWWLTCCEKYSIINISYRIHNTYRSLIDS